MKAAYITDTGAADVIRYGEIDKPAAGNGQVLVKMQAVSVNPIDTYIRGGANFWPLPNPFVIGCDIAGVVEEVGEDVSSLAIGDRVWGSNQGLLGRQGTFAEYAAIDAQWLYRAPENVPDSTLAANALVGITAHLGLVQHARLSDGETIFVRGGAGGVGSMVLQIAKALGARVITTAGSQDKADLCHRLGADVVIRYQDQDVAAAASQAAPGGVDVYWETLRDPDFDEAVALMSEGGRMVLMAGRDARPEFPVGPFYVKGCSLHGFAMFKASAETQRKAAEDLNRWMTEGKLQAVIDRTLPLDQAAQAHQLQEQHTLHKTSSLCGRIVLTAP